jgi:hypothetical protein
MHKSCLKLLELQDLKVINKKVQIGNQKSSVEEFNSLFSTEQDQKVKQNQPK